MTLPIKSCAILWIGLLHCFNASAQKERVFLDLDKYTSRAGQTVYFNAFITRGGSLTSYSTNLYVQVYASTGERISDQVLPIYKGRSRGQILFSDTLGSDNYFIIASTKAQLNYVGTDVFSVPVPVYNDRRPAPIHLQRLAAQKSNGTSGIIGKVSWVTGLGKDRLVSTLAMDSMSTQKRFSIVETIEKNSSLEADLVLSGDTLSETVNFIADSSQCVQPLYLYADSTLIARQYIQMKEMRENVQIMPDSLELVDGAYNSFEVRMPDSSNYYTSISVEDADRSTSAPQTITALYNSYTEDLTLPVVDADTAYLSFSGKATTLSGKSLTDPLSRELLLAGVKDSTFLFTKTVSIDSLGHFQLNSLFFYDSLALRFQINKAEDGRTKDLLLHLTRFSTPSIDVSSILSRWEDRGDTLKIDEFAYSKKEIEEAHLSNIKWLRPVTVKGRKDIRPELDHHYTSGAFSEPALYAYDVRSYVGDYNRDIFSYIDAQGGRLHYDRVGDTLQDPLNHPIHYYVNEQQYDHFSLHMFDFNSVAYIKILESDFLPVTQTLDDVIHVSSGKDTGKKLQLHIPVQKTPINVLIYTRKDKDFRSMPGGLNTVYIRGYDRILPFSPDNTTLCWLPWETGHHFRIHFYNTPTCHRIRVKVSGMTADGKIAYGERVFSQPN